LPSPDQAIENARWVLDRDPTYPKVANTLGRALILSGRTEEALLIAKDLWDMLGHLYAVTGRREQAAAIAAAHPDAPARQMTIYAALGDRERTVAALERVAHLHWWRAAIFMRYPEMAILRDDPRVATIRKRLGLPH
jgi:hypothetical protein